MVKDEYHVGSDFNQNLSNLNNYGNISVTMQLLSSRAYISI